MLMMFLMLVMMTVMTIVDMIDRSRRRCLMSNGVFYNYDADDEDFDNDNEHDFNDVHEQSRIFSSPKDSGRPLSNQIRSLL